MRFLQGRSGVSDLLPYRHRQIRCSHITGIDRSARNLSAVINVFGAFETSRIVAFEIVEVDRDVTVVPNNCATINEVSVAGDTDDLARFIYTVGLTVYMRW